MQSATDCYPDGLAADGVTNARTVYASLITAQRRRVIRERRTAGVLRTVRRRRPVF